MEAKGRKRKETWRKNYLRGKKMSRKMRNEGRKDGSHTCQNFLPDKSAMPSNKIKIKILKSQKGSDRRKGSERQHGPMNSGEKKVDEKK